MSRPTSAKFSVAAADSRQICSGNSCPAASGVLVIHGRNDWIVIMEITATFWHFQNYTD